MAIVVALLLWLLLYRTGLGKAIRAAVNDRELLTLSGRNVRWLFTIVFVIGGFFAGLAGAAMAPLTGASLGLGIEIIVKAFVVVVIGGLGSLPGALFGALYYFGAQFFLPPLYTLLATGLGMVVLLMIVPGGLGQIAYGWRDGLLRWIANRRGVMVPSLLADARVEESVLLPGAPGEKEPATVSGGSE